MFPKISSIDTRLMEELDNVRPMYPDKPGADAPFKVEAMRILLQTDQETAYNMLQSKLSELRGLDVKLDRKMFKKLTNVGVDMLA